MTRVLVVAWDGASPALIRRWTAAGALPVLAQLMEEGAWGKVQSTIPPVTAPAWGSFHTGTNPGRHGIYGWAVRQQGTYRPALADGRALSLPTFWELASDVVRVGVVGFPLTYPARELDGFWVPGLLTPPGVDGHPPGVMAELTKALPGYVATPPDWTRWVDPLQWTRRLEKMTIQQAQALCSLAGSDPPELLGVHFQTTDTVQHFRWAEPELLDVFRAADQALGYLIETLQPHNVVVLSDHGMGPVDGEFHINTWLLREGFLRLRRRPGAALREAAFRCGMDQQNLMSFGALLYPVARRLGLLRNATDLWAEGKVARLLRRLFLSWDDVDWRRTWAFAQCEIGSISLNRRGREPEGIVRPEDAQQLLDELSDGLRSLRVPGGARYLGRLHWAGDVYRGNKAHLAPDLLFLPRGLRWPGKGLGGFQRRRVFGSPTVRAGHRMQGLLVMHGQGVRPGRGLRGTLADLAPTILTLLGARIPVWMDGVPLYAAFEPGVLVPSSGEAAPVGSEGTSDDTVERLRGLGYL